MHGDLPTPLPPAAAERLPGQHIPETERPRARVHRPERHEPQEAADEQPRDGLRDVGRLVREAGVRGRL
ncbi:hypothetical protein DL769_006380 [Monosporascus sp. CRB-8-3]|nr:hypothetical protein DL769_006380 [Monosporascus sp. CRB-8-3]